MKEMMRRVLAFLTFDQFVSKNQIEIKLEHLLNIHKQESNSLGLTSIWQELIYEYWYSYVLKHFSTLFITVLVISNFAINKVSLPAVMIAGLISFSGLYWFFYRFVFNFIFLPCIDLIKEEFEQKSKMHLNKCRKAQLSNFTLLLIHYVFSNGDETSILRCNETCALMLTKIYGVDPGSMQKNLELLLIKTKRVSLTERKKTELQNRFSEAYNFLEENGYVKNIGKLKNLEMNFFK